MSVGRRSIWLLALSLLLFVGCASQLPPPVPKPKPVMLAPKPVVDLLDEAALNKIGRLYGSLAEARVRYWQKLILNSTNTGERQKLQKVNNFFNDARFLDDMVVWQQPNYWATPLEFLIMDAGDCEDFSIAKYFTLEKMGVAREKMRLTFVKSLTLNKAHMVLSYYPQPAAEPLILDNIEPRILPASQRLDLIPVYSFNSEDLWLSRTRTQQQKAEGKADTIKQWHALKSRRKSGVPLIQKALLPQR